ncbi:MAG: hypothetical protein NZ482_09885 [Gloeomargarita sp. SKYG98]|nr:hypothetical protein [Gloeomargarita sp. SKYG98]
MILAIEAKWADCPYVHYLDVDFIPGVYFPEETTFDELITVEAGSVWAGLGLALLLPVAREGELVIHQSQKSLYEMLCTYKALQQELAAARQEITTMQQSKFWKLRNLWHRWKRILTLRR